MKKKNNLSKNYVTEGFLELKFEELKMELDENAQKYHGDILNKLDEVMGELETIREEQTTGFHQYKELQEQVNGQDKKIKKIEQRIYAA